MLTRYKDFSPTPHDAAGLALPDKQEWIVVASRTRDSDCLTRSNFAVLLADFGGESATVTVARFGHWACGWFELLLVDPCHETRAEEWARALADYPVASDDHYSRTEFDEAAHVWDSWDASTRKSHMREYGHQCDTIGELVEALRGERMPVDTHTLVD